MPVTTFGGAYYQYIYGYKLDRLMIYRFLTSHGFSPDERPQVQLVDDPELAYVMARYREVHDFWHVLAGMRTF